VREVAQLVFFLGTLAPFLQASERPMARRLGCHKMEKTLTRRSSPMPL
jgi:hypothetical protein